MRSRNPAHDVLVCRSWRIGIRLIVSRYPAHCVTVSGHCSLVLSSLCLGIWITPNTRLGVQSFTPNIVSQYPARCVTVSGHWSLMLGSLCLGIWITPNNTVLVYTALHQTMCFSIRLTQLCLRICFTQNEFYWRQKKSIRHHCFLC